MKVNISGRGVIPGIGTLAPIYGYDASKELVARIINYKQFHVYVAATGAYVTKSNIDKVFAPKVVKTDKPADTPIIPKAEPEKVVVTTLEATTELVESVKTTPLPEITEDVVTEESTYDPEAVTASDDKPAVDVIDTVDTEDTTEEAPTEETTKQVYYNKKKKGKNRNNYNNK